LPLLVAKTPIIKGTLLIIAFIKASCSWDLKVASLSFRNSLRTNSKLESNIDRLL